MPSYTLFALDPRSGRMDQFANYDADDDETAIDVAARFSKNRPTELWSKHRQVATFGQTTQAVGQESPLP
jgi:hypothetical protein